MCWLAAFLLSVSAQPSVVRPPQAVVTPAAAPDERAPSVAPERDPIEREKLALDRERLALEVRRVQNDERISGRKHFWDVALYFLSALGVLLSYGLGRFGERKKQLSELSILRDQELRKERLKEYRELWSRTQAIALYAPDPLTYEGLPHFAEKLREWYFERGGLLLSEKARDRYFALIDAVERVAEEAPKNARKGRLNRAPPTPGQAKNDEKAWDGFRSGGTLPEDLWGNETLPYRFLRALGSLLRTQLTVDVGSRVKPVTAGAP
jgi:hypothetical protein